MSRKSESKTAVAHRSAHQRHHRTRDTVSGNKARTSAITGHSRWEDYIVSYICRFCFHSRSLTDSSLSSGLFERDCPLSQSSLFRNSTVSMRHSLCVQRTIPPVEHRLMGSTIPTQNRLSHQIVQYRVPFQDLKLTFPVSCRTEQFCLHTYQGIVSTDHC